MKLYLKDARLSFTQGLFDARQVQGQGEAKFSVSSIVEKDTQGFYGDKNPDSTAGRQANLKYGDAKAAITAAIMSAAGDKWGAKAAEIVTGLKAGNKLCLHDGDSKADTPGYKGNHFINASNKVKPAVVDRQGREVTAASGVIYPGCYGDVVLEIWAQDNQFGKRINASLLAVVFSKDGERLAGGGVATADDYAAIPEATQQQAAAAGSGAAGLF